MGGAACQIIIEDGNRAYGVLNGLAEDNPQIKINMLEAAIEASCQGSHHASLYFLIEGNEEKFNDEYSQPIIEIHSYIIHQLVSQFNQQKVDETTTKLLKAVRKLRDLYL